MQFKTIFALLALSSPLLAAPAAEPLDFVNVTAAAQVETAMSSLTASPQPNAAAWQMQTWSGTNCNSGDHLYFSVPANFKGCTQLNNVRSLEVTSLGACNTYFYHNQACQGNNAAIAGNTCYGYNDGSLIGSFYVYCTA